jgi:hypothetical protein
VSPEASYSWLEQSGLTRGARLHQNCPQAALAGALPTSYGRRTGFRYQAYMTWKLERSLLVQRMPRCCGVRESWNLSVNKMMFVSVL